MATKKSQEKSSHPGESDQPKHKQLVRMLSFRIVPAYYKKIERWLTNTKLPFLHLLGGTSKKG